MWKPPRRRGVEGRSRECAICRKKKATEKIATVGIARMLGRDIPDFKALILLHNHYPWLSGLRCLGGEKINITPGDGRQNGREKKARAWQTKSIDRE